tara:strand:+ start:954 stop:1562 length:609 start_codon:yes stop_codon:yes gene_type:complete
MVTHYKYCAGILPFCYFNHSLYFLLGKSKRNNRLITFSGKNDELESDPRETAAREGYEETLGCLLDKSSILEAVKRCDRILVSTTPRGMPCYTYVIEVPFRRYYTTSFNKTREFLHCMGINKMYHLQEMTDIKWLCSNTMFTKVRKTWERNGILKDNDQWEKLIFLVKSSQAVSSGWRRIEESDCDDDDDQDEISNFLETSL